MKLKLGISPCPNDTYTFHAIMNRRIDMKGLDLDIQLLDVQMLNQKLARNELDYSKASFHAALHLARSYGVLRAGAALGRGVGPLLLAATKDLSITPASRVLCPGLWTTASLLFKCFYPQVRELEQTLFSEIMPALKHGTADFGVVIHEGRFVYKQEGLHLVSDLGAMWEAVMDGPLPLGGILGRLELDEELHEQVNGLIRESLDYADAHHEEVFETMRQYSQELDPEVIWSHVELYVNRYTRNLGEEGEASLKKLAALAHSSEAVPKCLGDLKILR